MTDQNKNWFEVKETKQLTPLSLNELLNIKFSDPLWLVEPLIPQNGITIIAAPAASWKTFTTIDLIKSVASGTEFLGKFKTTKGKVLVINEDDVPRSYQERLLYYNLEKDLDILFLLRQEIKLDNLSSLNALKEIVIKNQIKLLILDHLALFHSLKENDADDMSYFYSLLKSITVLGCTIVILHHFRKPNMQIRSSDDDLESTSIRGSTAHEDNADSILLFKPLPEEDTDTSSFFVIKQKKNRNGVLINDLKIKVTKEIIDQKSYIRSLSYYSDYEKVESIMKKTESRILETLFKSQQKLTYLQLEQAGCGEKRNIAKICNSLFKRKRILLKSATELNLVDKAMGITARTNYVWIPDDYEEEPKVVEQDLLSF